MHESIVFVVRVWPLDLNDEGFRASVRRVDREEARVFTQPEELVRYLITRDHAADHAAGPGTGGSR